MDIFCNLGLFENGMPMHEAGAWAPTAADQAHQHNTAMPAQGQHELARGGLFTSALMTLSPCFQSG
jgi:hypothetical protein